MEKFERPWGWYQNLETDNGYKVKKLNINPNQKISLQYHNCRCEHWIVVFGDGKVEVDGNIKNICVGDYIFVPILSKHRIFGGNDGIIIIEVQLGNDCNEDDIIRIEDDYGRI